jgi:GT2 family glycosyltransferase
MMPHSERVSCIILSYNLPDKLVECVQSVLQQPEVDELILIENHSTAEMTSAYDTIRSLCASAEIILQFYRPDRPMSFSEGQNWGIDQAKNPLILLMNNDAMFCQPNTLCTSIRYLNGDVYVVGHKICDPDGKVNHFGVFIDPYRWYISHSYRSVDPGDHRLVSGQPFLAVTAASVLFRKTGIRFDTAYWFEYEDIDFCLTHFQEGKGVVCNSDCQIIHPESSSRSSIQNTNGLWIKKQKQGRLYFHNKWRKTLLLWGLRHRSHWWQTVPLHIRRRYYNSGLDFIGVLTLLAWVIYSFPLELSELWVSGGIVIAFTFAKLLAQHWHNYINRS